MTTKAPKEVKDKPQPSLIPMDLLIKYLCPAYEEGLIRYYRESWRLGFSTSHMYDATIRHLERYQYHNEDWDPDAEKLGIKKHHLAGALFSILCMLDTFENHPELDDRRNKISKGSVSFKDHLKESAEKVKKWEIYKQDILGENK